MPMPKLDDVFPHLDPKKADHELMAYAEACYAAGKADALPQWPPEDGTCFREKDWKGLEVIFYNNSDFCGWWEREDNDNDVECDIGSSAFITAAYFRGELEEV